MQFAIRPPAAQRSIADGGMREQRQIPGALISTSLPAGRRQATSASLSPVVGRRWDASAGLIPAVVLPPFWGRGRSYSGGDSLPDGWRRRVGVERSSPAVESRSCVSMRNFLEVETMVREHEIDRFGVVNHALYLNYCHHGQVELCARIGIFLDEVALSGEALAITNLFIKFITPLRFGDRFMVKSRISSISRVHLKFEHFIFKLPNIEPILEVKSTGVWLNKNYRLKYLPSKIIPNIILLDKSLDK